MKVKTGFIKESMWLESTATFENLSSTFIKSNLFFETKNEVRPLVDDFLCLERHDDLYDQRVTIISDTLGKTTIYMSDKIYVDNISKENSSIIDVKRFFEKIDNQVIILIKFAEVNNG